MLGLLRLFVKGMVFGFSTCEEWCVGTNDTGKNERWTRRFATVSREGGAYSTCIKSCITTSS